MKFVVTHRKLASTLVPFLSTLFIYSNTFVSASVRLYNHHLRKLAFFASSTDDRHNPNVNPRNSTNPPGLPQFTLRPSAKPSQRPTLRPTAKSSARPSASPTTKPSKRPSTRPTAVSTGKPSVGPTPFPTSKPSAKPTPHPSSRPTGKPSRKPTVIPSSHPSRRPTSQPTATPTTKPTRKRTSHPTMTPIAHPSKTPTSPPTIRPTFRPTIRPTAYPTRNPTIHPTINFCARNHYGSFGNTTSNNYIIISYNYEMVTNTTAISYQNKTITDIVRVVEYAITDALLRNLFSDCASYYEKTKKRNLDIRELTSGVVNGISAQPNDIITGDACDFSSTLSPTSDISCLVLQGRLSLYTDDILMQDIKNLQVLLDMALNLIKDSMNSGELATANNAIVVLRYKDDSSKMLAPILGVISPSHGNKDIVQWSLIGLAILAAFIALLAAARRYKKNKKKDVKVFHMLDDDKMRTDDVYDFDGLADFSMTLPSIESESPLIDKTTRGTTQPESTLPTPCVFYLPESPPRNENKIAVAADIEGIDDFMEHRFLNNDDLILDDITPLFSQRAYIKSHSDIEKYRDSDYSSLNCVHESSSSSYPLHEDDEQDYTYEGTGVNRGIVPKCSICFKNADGWMKRCQCGRISCDKIAHASCIYGKNPSPSISYPGTPPPMLPPILCSSENRVLRRSCSYDEESNALSSGLTKSLSFNESASAHDINRVNEGVISCLDCR